MSQITTERQKLVDRLSSVTDRAQTFLATADREERDLSDAEQSEFEKLTKDAGKLKSRIDSLEILNESDAWLNKGTGRITRPDGFQAAPALDLDLTRKSPTYSNLFGKPAGRHAFRDLRDFVKAACYGNDGRLLNANMSEGDGVAGGFLAPSQYSQALLDAALESEVIRPNCQVFPMTSAAVDLPFFSFTDRTGAKRAGLQMVMVGEGATNTAQNAITSNLKMVAKKGAIFVDVSSELESDTPNFSDRLGTQMSNAIAGGFDHQFVQGTGAGSPLGIVNSDATAVVTKEGSQTAGTVVSANLIKAAGRLHPSCWARAVWLISPSALPQLLTLSQDAGPANGGRTSILGDSDGVLRLLTRPVIITDACSAVGTKGDVILADLSQYVIGLRKEIGIERDLSSGWKNDLVGFRTIVRFDGSPAWPSAVTPRAGSDSLSAFVVIETRA